MKLRVLVAKPGLDGHDRGVKIIARALRDAGIEVIYAGLHQTPAQIVAAAIQEDVDGIGLSTMSGAHLTLIPEVLAELRRENVVGVPVFAGGIIPDDDAQTLRAQGVAAIFGPGTSTEAVVDWVRANLQPRGVAPSAPSP